MVDVFISYSRSSRKRVEPIKQKLDGLGLDCFFDMHQIDGGANFPDVIDRALRDSRSVLCCWSPAYFQGQWSMIECRDAMARGIIVPVAVERFEQFAPPADLRQINWLDLVDWNGEEGHEEWKRTMQNLGKLIGRDLIRGPQAINRGAGADTSHASAAVPVRDRLLEDLRTTWAGFAAKSDVAAVERFLQRVHDAVPGSGLEFEIEDHFDRLSKQADRRTKEAEIARAVRQEQRTKDDAARRAAAQARLRPAAVWRDTIPGMPVHTVPEMVTILPGEIAKQAAAPDGHGTPVDYPFALSRHPVTYADLDAAIAVGADLEWPADHGKGRGCRAAVQVSGHDAQAYADWLNARLGLTGRSDAYRLPSGAEWEFSLCAPASEDEAGEPADGTARRAANAFGLHLEEDEVWEWCEASGGGPEKRMDIRKPPASPTGSAGHAEENATTRRDDLCFRLAKTLTQNDPAPAN